MLEGRGSEGGKRGSAVPGSNAMSSLVLPHFSPPPQVRYLSDSVAQSRGDEVLFRCTPAIGGGGARCVCGGGRLFSHWSCFPPHLLPHTHPTPLHTLHSPSLLLLRELVEQAASDASVALDEVSELLALLREPAEQLDDATCQVRQSVGNTVRSLAPKYPLADPSPPLSSFLCRPS